MPTRVFKRKLYDEMLSWKQSRDGSTALLIKGARRVGKSTIAREFARNEYKSYILIDFIDAPREIVSLFDNTTNLDDLFTQLQYHYQVKLTPRRSVIIFDEVQACPQARQSIRRLVNDHRYDYIETGSLISIKRNVQSIRIPSEETRLTLYPLDYEEFRWAMGDEVSIPMLREAFVARHQLGDAAIKKAMRDFRLYQLIGGMPQAVDQYLATQNMEAVDAVKRDIIDLYADDFMKIDPTGRATRLFYSIPAQLNSNASRYKISSAIENGRTDRVEEILQNMEDSQTVLVARHANDPNVGFSLHADTGQFKLFLADTGLFVTLAFRDKKTTENIIYQKLLANKLSADLGYVYENTVAQMLKAAGHELFYYTWPTPNGKHNYEVDFLLSHSNKVCPIEVKSSSYKTHASLDAFREKFSDRIDRSYLLYTKDIRRDENVLLVPVCMSMFL